MKQTSVEKSFLRSMTVAVALSSLILSAAEGSRWPAIVTPFLAVLTHVFVDSKRLFRLPVTGANTLGVIAFLTAAIEFQGNDLLGKLLSGAHLLVYMTWIVLLLKKGIRQFWWLLGLCVLQLAVASVLTTQPSFGASLVLMLFVLMWVLAVFTLYRAQLRTFERSGQVEDSLEEVDTDRAGSLVVRNGIQIDTDESWLSWRIRGIVSLAWLGSLFIGVIAFLVFPRIRLSEESLADMAPGSLRLLHQTGFTKSVELGEIGQILQTRGRVLQFEIERMATEKPVSVATFVNEMKMDEILFRGHTLAQYRDGKWDALGKGFFEHLDPFARLPVRGRSRSGDADFRVRITQDAPVGPTVFAPAPFTNARPLDRSSRRDAIRRRLMSNTLEHRFDRDQTSSEPVSYEIWCRIPESVGAIHEPREVRTDQSVMDMFFDSVRIGRQFGFGPVSRGEVAYIRDWFITRDLESSLPELTRLAREICEEEGERADILTCCRKIRQYLSDPQNFSYSLNADVVDGDLDPIEDFLLNRRSGHCEYFATSCALMLQSLGIPARVVNGYKGSEENSVSGRSEVRQYHGHTWAEAWVDGNWLTLDPTPVSARTEGITTQRTQLDVLSDLRLTVTDAWYALLRMMNQERQEAIIRPLIIEMKKKLREIRRQGIWVSLKTFVLDFLRDPGQWFSATGWIVTFFVLLIAALIVRSGFIRRMLKSLQDAFAWFGQGERQQRSVVRFYEHFRSLCASNGLPLPTRYTALENAQAATDFFSARLRDADDQMLPQRIASAFNRVRFGHALLTEDAVAAVGNDVERFSVLLSQKTPSESVGENGDRSPAT